MHVGNPAVQRIFNRDDSMAGAAGLNSLAAAPGNTSRTAWCE
jgi:hypothetical protein